MANNSRRQATSLGEAVQNESQLFEFHAFVRALEAFSSNYQTLATQPYQHKEALLLKVHTTLMLSGHDIHAAYIKDFPKHQGSVYVNFFGLTTLQGPLPQPYRDLLLERIQQKDFALRDFLDIFNHRLLSLFHRIRKKYWIGVDIKAPETTPLGTIFLNIIGISNKFMHNRLPLPDRSLLYFSGLLWSQSRSHIGLERILHHFFKVPTHILPFCGKWEPIPPKQRTLLGGMHQQFHKLGHSAIIGSKVWFQDQKFIIKVGPLTIQQFQEYLSPGHAFHYLHGIVNFYTNAHFSYDLQLTIKEKNVPQPKLGKNLALGWLSWLKARNKDYIDTQVHIHGASLKRWESLQIHPSSAQK